MEYLEERYPKPPLLPAEPAERARVRLAFERFDELSEPYYGVLFEGRPLAELEAALASFDAGLSGSSCLVGTEFSLADIAYVPWIVRAQSRAGINLDPYSNVYEWLGRLSKRPSIATEPKVTLGASLYTPGEQPARGATALGSRPKPRDPSATLYVSRKLTQVTGTTIRNKRRQRHSWVCAWHGCVTSSAPCSSASPEPRLYRAPRPRWWAHVPQLETPAAFRFAQSSRPQDGRLDPVDTRPT
jgi:hypothetical protein